ncbi:hypothetical protein LDO26_12845 [Luteimonas sp. BDR2-5]|uniref:XAC0095 family protein n=1 Tax=Proluteimonas luteida TaxID=2878685 RepID=UPI001E3364CE|nr:hypothetical protein [Luteimonas sp. BDR2-5]MCD9029089.1 hypothetical protein [Luteimonas sp. BDR2-5]
MSKFDTGEFETTGYLLPEDSEFRLKKLCKHMKFLAYLAQPRTADEERDFRMDIRPGEVAVCLELLAEQAQLVLDTVAWPARLQPKGKPEITEDDDEARDDTEAGESAAATAADDDYDFGMTMDQLDEINRLLDLLSAQGDLMMASGEGDVAKGTIIVTGSAIFDGAEAIHAIIQKVESQVLEDDDPRAKPRRVRETPPLYSVHAVATAKTAKPRADHRANLH